MLNRLVLGVLLIGCVGACKPRPSELASQPSGQTSAPIYRLPPTSGSFWVCSRRDAASSGCTPFSGWRGDFDWQNAYVLGMLANLAYQGAEEVRQTLANYRLTYAGVVSTRDDFGLVAETDTAILVSFRGTDLLSCGDIKTDTDAVYTDFLSGSAHRGFVRAFRRLQPYLDKILVTRPGKPVWFTGHSLGGAMAVIAAAHYAEKGVQVGGLYTFGTPRLVSRSLVKKVNSLVPSHFRFVFNRDPVARIPGYTFFRHTGFLRYLDTSCQLKRETRGLLESLMRSISDSALAQIASCHRIKDHKLHNYTRCLESRARSFD